MFEYFYHEIMRRTIISFGSIFNNVNIQHTNSDDSVVSSTKVPLAYGPTQKFLARLEQVPDLNRPVQISLPRMSFELNGLNYCLLYTSPSPRDVEESRMPSSA